MTESFLDIAVDALGEAQELAPLQTDDEVELRIIDVRSGTDKNGNPYVMPKFEIVGEPTTAEFTKFLSMPNDGMDAKRRNNAALQLRRFLEAFDIDYSGGRIDIEAMIGQTAWALIGVDQNEGSEFGPQNYVKKFVRGN